MHSDRYLAQETKKKKKKKKKTLTLYLKEQSRKKKITDSGKKIAKSIAEINEID